MAPLSKHTSSAFVKLLALGDAKVGKTTSLASLVAAGYKLRILDMDNLVESLRHKIMETCPAQIDNVELRTLRDKYSMTANGPQIAGSAKAFTDAIRMLDDWKYKEADGTEVAFGKPATWDPDCILVIDSLSRLCDAAYDWRLQLAGGAGGKYDGRAVYGDAQDAVEGVLAGLTSVNFPVNVIVIAHGLYMDMPDGTRKIFPQGVGQKLSPKIPQYFPYYIRYKNVNNKRTLQLKSDPTIDLATPASLPDSLPAETGLADIFKALRGTEPQALKATPKPTLKRA